MYIDIETIKAFLAGFIFTNVVYCLSFVYLIRCEYNKFIELKYHKDDNNEDV